jgi:Transcription elongation factor, N-terminal
MTLERYRRRQDELRQLLRVERPKLAETVAWAAGNGDRSENGDYIYGKRRLREIDRRIPSSATGSRFRPRQFCGASRRLAQRLARSKRRSPRRCAS